MNNTPNHPPGEPADERPLATRVQAEMLEQKFLALNLLSAGVAHEFNNVIAGILGCAELIGMDLHEGHPAYDSLKQIYEASSRGRDLLHKVRTFAQRPPIALQTLQLSSLIEETAQILRGIIPDKLELKVRVEPHFPVLADPVQIQQLVMDLCLHCWQNLHERRGTIQILLQNHRLAEPIGLLAAGEVVRLTVQDDSPGLDAAALRKVFHPFQTRKASSKKIGLELFMAKETALAHRGDLIAVSQPGQGLAFHLYLPVAATA